MPTGASIVASARGWLGTRFHHQGRVKKTTAQKGGVDCLGLLVGIAKELNITAPDGMPLCHLDVTDYPHYPDSERLRHTLSSALLRVPEDVLRPGDILLLDVDGNPQHLAIVGDCGGNYSIIHAYAPARAVVEHMLDDWWRAHIVAAFRVQ